MEIRSFKTFDVRTNTDDSGNTLHGYASVFNSASENLGGFIEYVAPTAFTRSLASPDNIFALWSHDSSQPLGSTHGGKLTLATDAKGLAFSLDTKRMTPAQLDTASDGELRMSFGFVVRSETWEEQTDGTVTRTLNDVDLMEVSPCIFPAYPDTSAALRSLAEWRSSREVKPVEYRSDLHARLLATRLPRTK